MEKRYFTNLDIFTTRNIMKIIKSKESKNNFPKIVEYTIRESLLQLGFLKFTVEYRYDKIFNYFDIEITKNHRKFTNTVIIPRFTFGSNYRKKINKR